MGTVHALTAAARRPSSARYRRPAKAPLAKGGCLGSAEAGGFHRVAVFHMGLFFQEVPTVNPSVKNQRFLPAPFSKGAFAGSAR